MIKYTSRVELAVIIPVYNEADAILNNMSVIIKTLNEAKINCAYMLIDDGSSDETWKCLQVLKSKYHNVNILRFSRNFGKEIAICAGLDSIDANRYVIMDSDLQHPPKYIIDMIDLMDRENADIVEGIKVSRGNESLKYKLVAKGFYKFLKYITGLEMDNSSDFKLINNHVVAELRRFDEKRLFFRGLVNWVGFKKVSFPFEVEERTNGTSRFSTRKLCQLALTAILSYTSKPLYLTIFGGIIFLAFAFVLGMQTLYNFFSGSAVSGFSTVILLLLITGSMIMISLGIIGIYISRIYDEVKNRPRYIVSEREIKYGSYNNANKKTAAK